MGLLRGRTTVMGWSECQGLFGRSDGRRWFLRLRFVGTRVY